MADLITWSGGGGISFFARSNEIRGVKDITISASAETEDKTKGGEKFIKKKNKGSYQLTLNAVLNAALGVDVKSVAMLITEAARCGENGYFYTAGTKLFPCKFMCTDAKVNAISMTGSGTWKSCEVSMTLKQCDKYGGGSGSGKKSKKSKSKKSGTRSSKSSGKKKKSGKSANNVLFMDHNELTKLNSYRDVASVNTAAKIASTKALNTLTKRKVNASSNSRVVSKLTKKAGA